VKESGAIAAAHIACREPLKTLMAVRRTMFSVLFVDPWRIDPEMCHGLHLNANRNKNSNNAATIVPKSISFHSLSLLRYSPHFFRQHDPFGHRTRDTAAHKCGTSPGRVQTDP
jgi:hypothetical protein